MTQGEPAVIQDIMHPELEVIGRNETIVAAAERMRAGKIGSLLVRGIEAAGEGMGIEGIVTETDLVRKVIAKAVAAEAATVDTIMTSPLLTIAPDRPILDASHLMELNHVRHLCVSNGARLVGLVSVRDLVRHFVNAEAGPIRDLDDVYRPLSVLMRTDIEKIASQAALLSAARLMADKRIGSLIVVDNAEMVGIVTESDIVRNALPYNLDSTVTTVGSVMNRPLIDIDINRTVHDASELMAEKGIRHLVVTDQRKIVGVLSVRDLIKMVSVRDRPRFVAQGKPKPS